MQASYVISSVRSVASEDRARAGGSGPCSAGRAAEGGGATPGAPPGPDGPAANRAAVGASPGATGAEERAAHEKGDATPGAPAAPAARGTMATPPQAPQQLASEPAKVPQAANTVTTVTPGEGRPVERQTALTKAEPF